MLKNILILITLFVLIRHSKLNSKNYPVYPPFQSLHTCLFFTGNFGSDIYSCITYEKFLNNFLNGEYK